MNWIEVFVHCFDWRQRKGKSAVPEPHPQLPQNPVIVVDKLLLESALSGCAGKKLVASIYPSLHEAKAKMLAGQWVYFEMEGHFCKKLVVDENC